MHSRIMSILRLPSLLLAAALQLMPMVRAALPAAESASNILAIVFRWAGGLAAALGSVQAVSGASTVITTPLNQKGTNGVPLGNSQIRLTTAPDQAHYWAASGLPSGLYITNTSSTAFYIRGTPTVTGTFNVGLTAKDQANSGKDRTTTATMVIQVAPGANSPPTANPQSVTTAENTAKSITLTGSDPDGNTLTYHIVSQPAHGGLSGTGASVTYTPANNYSGPDSFTFKVNDGTADSSPATVSITVTPVNNPPAADAQSVSTAEDTAKAITLTGGDPDGNSLTYAIVTPPDHGTLTGTAPDVTYTPATNYNGPDSFTFTVNDGSVDSSPAMVSITVTPVNDPPVADAHSVSTAEDTAIAITLTGADPDGDSLTYAIVTPPDHGTLTGTAPDVTYTPATNYNGPDSFTFTVNDGSVDSSPATVSITVTPVNDPPVADAQSVSTAEGTAKAVTLTGADPDGDGLTYAVTVQPSHGSLSGTAPDLTYTPGTNYTGSDSFTFTVNDGSVDSAPATVSIDVTPVAPVEQPVLEPPAVDGSNLTLLATGQAGQSWNVEATSSLGGTWTNVGTLLINESGTGQYIITNRVAGSGFYRLAQP